MLFGQVSGNSVTLSCNQRGWSYPVVSSEKNPPSWCLHQFCSMRAWECQRHLLGVFPMRLFKAAEVMRARGPNPKLGVNASFGPRTPPASFGQAIGGECQTFTVSL